MPARREQIEALLADHPDDPFLRYSLALELEKEGRHAESLNLLERLTQADPPYVPAAFMAGQQLARLGRLDEARAVLRRGIELARAAGNLHAAGEMSEFLAGLGQLGEGDTIA
jgi:tetratricopeptide (TPR) repeat protein